MNVLRSIPIIFSVFALSAVSAPKAQELTQREVDFEKLMTNSKMVGVFTVTGEEKPPQEESYTIYKVEKVEGDRWRFHAKVEFGKRSVTIPIVVQVKWSGDTPMIQVSDMKIPLLGTYTARVLIHRNQYAGMWSGGDHGGHMYGRVVRGEAEEKKTRGDWFSWRGPEKTGVARNAKPPTQWSEDKNIRWKVALPGLGNSSPIIVKDRIYLTAAVNTGTPTARAEEPERRPPTRDRRRSSGRSGGFRGFGSQKPTTEQEFVVLAIDRSDGKIAWKTPIKKVLPHEGHHSTGSNASNSPITDGEHIYAHFGSRGLHCLDLQGKIIWSKDFGQMRTRNQFGEGSSPALHGNTLVVNWDHEGDSFVVALDKRTGEELWRQPRDEVTSWATPLIIPVEGRLQAIIPATRASRAYDLETGEVIWSCSGMTTNCIPTPVYSNGLVYLMSGFRGSAIQAIRLAGAKGDISDSDQIVWSHNRGTAYTPSPLLYGNLIYYLRTNTGILSCLDARTGETHYEGQRLDGLRTVYSSPVGADGRVYLTSREGVTKVIALGAQYQEIATNQLDDGFDASAAIVGSEIYLRGRENLYCISEQ